MKHACRLIGRGLTPKLQRRLAWGQLAIAIVGWPISLVIIDEPKVILSLSWWAVLATALDYISSSETNVQVSGEDGDR